MDVDASGQGYQVGDGNVQNNHFYTGDPRLDAASLGDLSSRAAATWVRDMRRDYAVRVLAQVPVDGAAKILAALLRTNEALTVTLLADISARKAQALIAALADSAPWLPGLPEAAEAIDQRADELQWTDGGLLERAAPSPQGREGYRRIYRQGQIYARPSRPAFAVAGAIAEYFEAHGGTAVLGFPTSRESQVRSPQGADGSTQNFGWVKVLSSAHGVFAVKGKIRSRYADDSYAGDWLGFPVSEEQPRHPASGSGSAQRFEGGTIFRDETAAIAVRAVVLDYLQSSHSAEVWFPAVEEMDAEVSPYRTTGQTQRFFTHNQAIAAVYSSAAAGIWLVSGGINELHARLGGTASWLGFPQSDRIIMPKYVLQGFEGGAIFERSSGTEAVAVVFETLQLFSQDHELRERLGFPLSAEEPVGTVDGDRCQFFENGIVTVKDGKREIWVRP